MRWRSRAALRLPGRELQSPADKPMVGLWGPDGSLPDCWVDPPPGEGQITLMGSAYWFSHFPRQAAMCQRPN